ncbi:MAG: hypothetical protein IJR02_02865 [Bacteroidaceae bacterium]|jgi:hypothetical protein|nr:hypothetical protein [Bacteroidaceae bacterium]
MKKDKLLGYLEVVGLCLVVVAACQWILPRHTARAIACVEMVVATVMLFLGRFLQTPFYEKYDPRDPKKLTLRRLYHQRVFGIIGLILATAFMFVPIGFYGGMYVGPSAWLIPFIFFVVVEVYTTFRISAVEKE